MTNRCGDSNIKILKKPLNKLIDEMKSLCPSIKCSHFKLIDSNMTIYPLPEKGLDKKNTNFIVIGAVGLQGVGKSTILSKFAQNCQINKTFKVQTISTRENGINETSNVEVLNTGDRCLLVDTPPLFSTSVLDHLICPNGKWEETIDVTPEVLEIESYRLFMLILSVCHVVLVVHDFFFDRDFFRRLEIAQMLRPIPVVSKDAFEQSKVFDFRPHVVHVFNKLEDSLFHDKRLLEKLESLVSSFPDNDSFIHRGSLGQELANVVLLPIFEEGTCVFNKRVKRLRKKLMDIKPKKFIGSELSESNWYRFVSETWKVIWNDHSIERFVEEEASLYH